MPETCVHCGATIVFIKNKWVTNPKKPDTWKCGNDRAFPVRAHTPKEQSA